MDGNNANHRKSNIDSFLRISEYFLSHRNFNGCRKYALRAQSCDAEDSRVNQILAVVDVVEASETLVCDHKPDWYAVLRLSRYSTDSQLIRNQFKNLLMILNPATNKFPLSKDAFMLVREAWAVLGDSSRKSYFDDELRVFESLESQRENDCEGFSGNEFVDTFWTMCPYCYYVYEYSRVYEDCCLRCQNGGCRRGFHAVATQSAPPPEVVAKGEYKCFGFLPLGFEGDSWTPFSSMGINASKEEVSNGNVCDKDDPIDISDNDGDGDGDGGDSSDEFGSKHGGGDTEKGPNVVETVNTEVSNVGKLGAAKRRKSVARNSKKLMGKGTRIRKEEIVAAAQTSEGVEMMFEESKYDGDDDWWR